MKELGSIGGRAPGTPPLDPPMERVNNAALVARVRVNVDTETFNNLKLTYIQLAFEVE